MAIITITIIESPIQLVAGIPTSISISTNIPSTIFYTLDGSDPNESSDIVVTSINLPSDGREVILKLLATNGVDSSGIISYEYYTSWIGDRLPRATIYSQDSGGTSANFTDNYPDLDVTYGPITGVIVDAVNSEGIPDQFDGSGTGTYADETDKPYHRWNYDIRYSETNHIGEMGHGIGTLPATVKVYNPTVYTTSNQSNSPLFNPRSMVIIQDGRLPQDPNVSVVNRQSFSLANPEKQRDGAIFGISSFDGLPNTGTFLKAHYRASDNTYHYYYRDSSTNRWIISIEPATKSRQSNSLESLALYQMPATSFAEKKVFQWLPFRRKYL